MTMNECVKQTEHLFKLNAKVLHLFKTLKQNESCAVVKFHCVASELSNDNDDDEKTPQSEILFQLFDNMSNDF